MFKKSFNLLAIILLIFIVCLFGQEGKKVIPLTTKSEEALEYYSKAFQAMSRAYEKEAVENLEKAIKAAPTFVMARALYAVFLSNPENQQMIDEAKKYFDKVTEAERMFTLAIEAAINNNRDKERKILEELTAQYPDDATVHLRLTFNYFFANNYEKTIAEAKKLLKHEQNSYSAYNFLGYANLQIGNFQEAIKWLKKYAALMPKSANPLDSLGDAYKEDGRYKEAWECYQKAIAIKPDFTPSLIHLGDVKHELGYYEEAVSYYQEGLMSLLPEKEISESRYRAADSFFRLRLVNNYLYMGEVDKAEKMVTEEFFYANDEEITSMKSQKEEGVDIIFQRNYIIGNICGHYLAAKIALEKQNIQKAKKEAELAQRLEKENNFLNQEKDQIVNFIRAKIALAEDDLLSAEKFALAAVNAFPEEGRAFMLSMIYPLGNSRRICVEPINLLVKIKRRQNRIDDEIEMIMKSLKLIPHQPKLHYRLGEIYAQQNKMEEAEKAYKKFLTLCKDFNCSEEAKKKAEKFVE